MKTLFDYTMDIRETFEIGDGWLGLKIVEEMLNANISGREYDVYSYDDSNKTYVTTWSKECKEVLKSKGYVK